MIFQEPTTSLNPCFTIGFQLAETLQAAPRAWTARPRGAAPIELLEQVGIPARGEPPQRLPAPDVGRHEPARDDRHGDRLQPAAADRRRADHRARRDHPGADPGPAARPAEGARHGAGADHAQHGRGGRDGAARRRDVRRPGDGGARAPTRCSPRRSTPTPRRCWRRCPSAATASRAWPPFPAWCPGLYDRPAGCLFAPRCSYADRSSAAQRPALRAWQDGQVRCHYPLGDAATRSASRATPDELPRMSAGACRSSVTPATPVVAARDLRQVYAIRRGLFREPAQLQAVGGVSFSIAAGTHAGRGRRVRLRQVDAGAHGLADRDAHRGRARASAASTRSTPAGRTQARLRQVGADWCSRTPTARSIRARRSARSSKRRWRSTPTCRRRARRAGARRCSPRSACAPSTTTATRTCSRAASASASRSRAR